jgi:hypothetical protein
MTQLFVSYTSILIMITNAGLRVNSVRMVYLHRFFSDLKAYLVSLSAKSRIDNEQAEASPTSHKCN